MGFILGSSQAPWEVIWTVVHTLPIHTYAAKDRADENDLALVAKDHIWQRGLDQMEGTKVVELHLRPERAQRNIQKIACRQ